MDKKEIEKQIDRVDKIIDKLEPWLTEAINLRAELSSYLEAEKPKLRHGDFGIDRNKDCLSNWIHIKGKTIYANEEESGFTDDEPILIKERLGNIFDLLKEWSEDYPTNFWKYDIRLEQSYAESKDIYLNAGEKHLTLSEAEEVWHWFGRKIAALKRKQRK